MERSQAAGPVAAVMLVYIVFVVGRLEDIVPGLPNLPVAKIAAAIAIFVALQNRTALSTIRTWSVIPIRLTLLIMILITVSILWSELRSATFETITGMVLATTVGAILMVKAARNWRALRLLLLGFAVSAIILALSVEMTRFAGRAGYTRDMDPNDFAFALVGLLPIVVTFAVVSRRFKKIAFGVASIWVVFEILNTQSRGGLLGLVSVIAILTVLLPASQGGRLIQRPSRTLIATRVMLLAVGAVALWHAIPEAARDRLATITSPGSGYNTNLDDPTGRFAIWKQTLPLSLRRPWGWGAGAFSSVDGRFGGGRYMAAHNMYLQGLIDLGIEGLGLFLAAIVINLRRLLREGSAHVDPKNRDALERSAFARGLVASLVGLSISGFFLAEFYRQDLWMMIILASLLGRDSSDLASPAKHLESVPPGEMRAANSRLRKDAATPDRAR